MIVKTGKILMVLLMVALLLGQQPAQATEFGSSYYFPGISITFAPGLAPHTGVVGVEQMLFMNTKANVVVLGGRVETDVKSKVFLNVIGVTNTFKSSEKSDKTFQVGVFLPYGNVDVRPTISTAQGSRSISSSSTDIGDTTLIGAMYWKNGDYHYKIAETIYAPTGAYDRMNLSNVGRNYWGFDTTFAVTHVDMKSGIEWSIAPGILFNTRNEDSDYKSGNEFHIEFALNHHYFKQHYAVGLQGYYYKQITGDSGSGAKLGSFQGEAFGIGPAVLWTPPSKKGNLSVIAKWLFDVEHQNRLHGDFGQLIVAYKF